MIDIIILVVGFTQHLKKAFKGKNLFKAIWGCIKTGEILIHVTAIGLGIYLNMEATSFDFWNGVEGALLGLAATGVVALAKEKKSFLEEVLNAMKDGRITDTERMQLLKALEKPKTNNHSGVE